uniref:Uncharacterized protein n=1 Tax=Aegilops tauschii subsp. strangulata TaxID=200361 RepID=A0A453BJ24_AEGTS
ARNHHGPGCSHTSGVPTRPTRATAHPSETKTEAPPRQQKAVRSRPAVAESPPPPTTSTSTAIHLCPKSDDHGPIESSHQHIRRWNNDVQRKEKQSKLYMQEKEPRIFILILLSLFVAPNSSGVASKFVYIAIVHIERISQYDWCLLCLGYMLYSIKKQE